MDSTLLSFEETMQTDELEHHTFNNTLVDESVLDDDCIIITDDLDEHALLDEVPKIDEINQQKETEPKCATGDNEGFMRSLNFEDAEDRPNMHDDQLTIESLFERTDEKEEVTEWASNISEIDDLTILGGKPEVTLSKRDATENGDHQVSDFRTIDDEAAISRLIDDLVQKVTPEENVSSDVTTSKADTNEEFDMDINKVTTFSDSIQHNLYESHSQEQNQDCFNGIKEADGHNKVLGLTRPELKRYVHARLNACCTNKECLTERRLLKQRHATDEQTIKTLNNKFSDVFNFAKDMNEKYKLLKETHLEFQKSLVILRSQVAALKSDETSSQARSSHTDLRIPSMSQQRNHASASQNGAIIYGIRPAVNVPSAARFARSLHHQNLAHLASVPLIKKPKLVENNPPIKMSQLASGSQGSSLFMDGSVNGSLPRPSLKDTVAYQTPLVQLFGRDIANNVRINVDLGHIAPRDIPLPMQTMVLPKSIDGHRLPSVSRKSDYSPEILVTTPIENLLIAKKLHASIRYRLPSTVSAADCAMGVFYYIRSELFPDRPPNWKIGPLIYASDQGKPAKLCFDFSHDMALNMEGVVAIAVLFTPTGNHASDALRYDIPDKRMQALAAGRQSTDFF